MFAKIYVFKYLSVCVFLCNLSCILCGSLIMQIISSLPYLPLSFSFTFAFISLFLVPVITLRLFFVSFSYHLSNLSFSSSFFSFLLLFFSFQRIPLCFYYILSEDMRWMPLTIPLFLNYCRSLRLLRLISFPRRDLNFSQFLVNQNIYLLR